MFIIAPLARTINMSTRYIIAGIIAPKIIYGLLECGCLVMGSAPYLLFHCDPFSNCVNSLYHSTKLNATKEMRPNTIVVIMDSTAIVHAISHVMTVTIIHPITRRIPFAHRLRSLNLCLSNLSK